MIPNISSQSRTNYKQQLKRFIQTDIGEIVMQKSFNTAYPYEMLWTPFLVLQEASQTLKESQEIDVKWQVTPGENT